MPYAKRAVYDLTIERDHCYYANGLLVSNCGYMAGSLFPLGKLQEAKHGGQSPRAASYFNTAPHPGTSLGMARKGVKLPKEARTIGDLRNGGKP